MKSIIKIGRDRSNDIEINEPRVSRFHATITWLGDDRFEIKDLNSTNGTYVNGDKITTRIITEHDRIEIAGCMVKWFEEISNPKSQLMPEPVNEEPFSKIIKTVTIGSLPDNDIILDNEFVSGQHAKISLLKNGEYFIHDSGSSNGTFINGTRVISKNFAKTDILKIAFSDLPPNWFSNPKLKKRPIYDNRKVLIALLLLALLAGGTAIYYFFGCRWFGCNCELKASEIFEKKKDAAVYISHSFYYTITYEDKVYYIGKNKVFKVTEANTSVENLLPYDTVAGNGFFLKNDGTILTTFEIANPWLNIASQNRMILEVVNSKTINTFSLKKDYKVCGITAELKWLANGLVNNKQNYVEAISKPKCVPTDTLYAVIQSVRLSLPAGSVALSVNSSKPDKHTANISKQYYYSHSYFVKPKLVLQDTFYSAIDNFNIRDLKYARLNKSLPMIENGSAVLDDRGNLIGIVSNENVVFLHLKF